LQACILNNVQTSSAVTKGIATWGLVGAALGLIAIATLVPIPHGTAGGRTPFWCLGCGDDALADALANVALFVPLGWAIARTGLPLHRGLVLVLTTTISVELLQGGFVAGRVASASDVLANTVGGAVGMALPFLRRRIRGSGRRAPVEAGLYGVLLITGLLGGEALQAIPLPRTLRWTEGSLYATEYVPFLGSLRAVQVDGTPVALHGWLTGAPGDGATIAVDLTSGRPDTGLAQIVIAWMPNGNGWMWLEQRDRDLRVHVASASDRARFRGHSTWLAGVMPAVAGEPVTIRLAVRPFWYRIVVATKPGEVVRDVSITPGDGWRLFTPFERSRERWASWLTAAWMAALLAPLGYLTAVRSRITVLVAAASAGALLLLPVVSGCGWLPLSSWCGVVIGLVIGSQIGARDAIPD
jgi:hypothetical protein